LRMPGKVWEIEGESSLGSGSWCCTSGQQY